MTFKIRVELPARDGLRTYSKQEQNIILSKIESQLSFNPFPRGKTIKKLKGFGLDIYRLRVNASQSYRVFFQINEKEVSIVRIVPKKDADRVIRTMKKYLS